MFVVCCVISCFGVDVDGFIKVYRLSRRRYVYRLRFDGLFVIWCFGVG